jgi:hypothetical protein
MPSRPRPSPPLTSEQESLLRRWPDLATLPRADWPRAARHLEDANTAREAGLPCPWCTPPGTGKTL